MQLSCCVQKTMFPCSCPPSLALSLIPNPSLYCNLLSDLLLRYSRKGHRICTLELPESPCPHFPLDFCPDSSNKPWTEKGNTFIDSVTTESSPSRYRIGWLFRCKSSDVCNEGTFFYATLFCALNPKGLRIVRSVCTVLWDRRGQLLPTLRSLEGYRPLY